MAETSTSEPSPAVAGLETSNDKEVSVEGNKSEGNQNNEIGALEDTVKPSENGNEHGADGAANKESSRVDNRDWRARREEDQKRESDKRRGNGRHKPRGGHRDSRGNEERRNFTKNVKSDYSQQPESNDPDEIRKQVEFYFSDSNLPTDRFLFEKVGGKTNNAVPISVIHSFKRMRHFQPFSAVVAALKESSFLEVVDNDTAVRRQNPLPDTLSAESHAQNVELMEDATRPRSIYAKGFGDEGPTTQFDIEAFFAPYGPTNAIRLRRHADKTFKGSVFVEFDSEETQAAFLALDPKPKWEGKDLSIMSKEQYVRGKAEDIAAGRIQAGGRRTYRSDRFNGPSGRTGKGAKDGRVHGDRPRRGDGKEEEHAEERSDKTRNDSETQKDESKAERNEPDAMPVPVESTKRPLADQDEPEASSKKVRTEEPNDTTE